MDNNNNNNNKNLHDYHTIDAKPVELENDYVFFRRSFFFKITSIVVVFLIKVFIYFIYGKLILGLRVKNKKRKKLLKKEGFILVSNHIHPLDAIWLGAMIFPKKVFVTMLQTNLGLPFVGKFLRIAGGVPIPLKREQMPNFLNELKNELNQNISILVMVEAAIKPYHIGIRKFFNGAFRFAVNSEVRILPFVYIYRKRKGLFKFIFKKPRLELHILEPYEPVIYDKKSDSIKKSKDDVHYIMSNYFNQYSDLKDPDYKA